MQFLSTSVGIISLLLQATLVLLLLRGYVSRYFPIFLYLVSNLIASVFVTIYLQREGEYGEHYFSFYWGSEILLGLLLFLAVISMTHRALEGTPQQPVAMKVLGVVLVAVLVLPFILFQGPVFSANWNSHVTQLFYFGAGVMNLVLWTALLLNRKRDRQLLAVSAGLGVLVAGGALSYGVLQLSSGETLRGIANIAIQLAYCSGFLILCWTFKSKPSPQTVAQTHP